MGNEVERLAVEPCRELLGKPIPQNARQAVHPIVCVSVNDLPQRPFIKADRAGGVVTGRMLAASAADMCGGFREGKIGGERLSATRTKRRAQKNDRFPTTAANPGGNRGWPDLRPDDIAAGGAGNRQQKIEGPVQEPPQVLPTQL